MRSLVAAVALLPPSLAVAGPVTVGANLGVIQGKDTESDAANTLGLWGRLGFSTRLAGQLEVLRIRAAADGTTGEVRTGTALLVVDLMDGGALMPVLVVGLGLDRASNQWGGDISGHHIEGGFGLEYRSPAGLTLGAEVRLGGRSVDNDAVYVADTGGIEGFAPIEPILPYPSELPEGEYRQARINLGIRF